MNKTAPSKREDHLQNNVMETARPPQQVDVHVEGTTSGFAVLGVDYGVTTAVVLQHVHDVAPQALLSGHVTMPDGTFLAEQDTVVSPCFVLPRTNDLPFQVFVKSPTGKTVSLVVNANVTGLGLKHRVMLVEGTPVHNQRLMFFGVQLKDAVALGKAGVRAASTISLYARRRSGDVDVVASGLPHASSAPPPAPEPGPGVYLKGRCANSACRLVSSTDTPGPAVTVALGYGRKVVDLEVARATCWCCHQRLVDVADVGIVDARYTWHGKDATTGQTLIRVGQVESVLGIRGRVADNGVDVRNWDEFTITAYPHAADVDDILVDLALVAGRFAGWLPE